MTMQALKQAGLYVGEQLTPADPSNADGHFEDIETVALHDQWLHENGSNWCHSGELPVVDKRIASDAIRAVANRLGSKKRAWGVKDPRACLFLPYWFAELEALAGIFTYRHFASCYESLQRRHGNDLLLNPGKRDQSLTLFAQPDLGLASWLAYNKGLIAQVKNSPEQCLLLSQQALVSGYPLVQEVNRQFATDLSEAADLRIDQSKVRAKQSVHLPYVEQHLIDELQHVWEELQRLSVAPSTSEPTLIWARDTNVVPIKSKDPEFSVQQAITKLAPYWDELDIHSDNIAMSHTGTDGSGESKTLTQTQATVKQAQKPIHSALPDINDIDFNSRADVNKALSLTKQLSDQRELIETGLSQYPDSSFLHGLLGKCLFNLKAWNESLFHLNFALAQGCDDPSVHFHVALWHLENGEKRDAIRSIQLALGLRRNADHLILLVNLLMQERDFDEAQRLTLLGYEWFALDQRFVLLHADALFSDGQVNRAIEWCQENDSAGDSHAIAQKLYELYIQSDDSDKARLFNTESQRRRLQQFESYANTAVDILQSLGSDYARMALTNVWCDSLQQITTPSRPVFVSTSESAPSVAMSILVRDEVDIIESNIRFHAEAGVDHFIVTDNASIDGTRDVLASLKNEISLDIIDEPSHTIDQDLWVTRMARQIQMTGQFDWIIHNDADEFWVPKTGSIPNAIQASLKSQETPAEKTGVLACKRHNMLTAEADVLLDDYAFHDNVYAVVQNVPLQAGEQPWSDENCNCVARLVMDKVLTRTAGLSTVEYGNHGAEHTLQKSQCEFIEVLHFPVRTYAQFERKVINYGESLARNTRFSAGSSLHLRYWYKRYLEGCLEEDYRHMIFNRQRLQSFLESGQVRIDNRVSDFFKTVTLGAMPLSLAKVA